MMKTIPNNVAELPSTISAGRLVHGKVFLVGAGPGAPDLLTLKAYRLLEQADVVLYDALISDEILQLVSPLAFLVHVGKRNNQHYVTQSETNELMVKYARLGKKVVRLKGGDPFIFGRGGEEGEFLYDSQVDFEVVPGITAASGCASYAGIPLTHRRFSHSVHFVTPSHQKNDACGIDWHHLAKSKQTLVFYMGLFKNEVIQTQLIRAGMSSSSPVALIENGTQTKQRVITTGLADLHASASQNRVAAPALIIIGEVVKLSNKLNWFGAGSLSNALESRRPSESEKITVNQSNF